MSAISNSQTGCTLFHFIILLYRFVILVSTTSSYRKKRHFLIKTYRLTSEDSIMRSLHCLITSFVSSPSAYPECTYLCSSIVETKHHNHIFINMIAHTAAFVSTISPIYIQPQSGP